MEELVARVAAAADIPSEQALRTIRLVFAFLQREAPAEADEILTTVPGAAEAAAEGNEDKPKSGLLGGLMGMVGGGGLMGLAAQLTSIGLGPSEMQNAGKEIFAFAREKAGDARVAQVASAIPGLSQFV